MSTRTDYSYIGVGKVWMRERGADAPFVDIGNISKLTLGVTEEEKKLQDFTSLGGGVLNSVPRITDVTFAATLHELKPGNIAMLLRGGATAVVAGSVADEEVQAYLGGLIPLLHASPTVTSVKNDNAGEPGATTYAAGTDYEVRAGGLYIPATSSITNDSLIHVAYSYGAEDVIEALTNAAKEYELQFEGLNEAQSGKAMLVDVWRVRTGAAKDFNLVGDNFAGFDVSGSVFKDPLITATGKSQYFRVRAVV